MRATLCLGVTLLRGTLLLASPPSFAQGTAADYERANGLRAKYEALADLRP